MDVVLPREIAELEIGRAHCETTFLGFTRTGDGAAVVVRQHHHGFPLEAGIKGAFAADEEAVAIYEGVHAL